MRIRPLVRVAARAFEEAQQPLEVEGGIDVYRDRAITAHVA